jgi:hypothetical protein
MSIKTLKEKIVKNPNASNELFDFKINDKLSVHVYANSIIEQNDTVFFIAKENLTKWLFLASEKKNDLAEKFEGSEIESDMYLKKCALSTKNRKAVQNIFLFSKSVVLGLHDSFGFGDRLGLANAGHIRSLYISDFKPILAQQSIRELTRTNRTPDDVMDAAVWAVFQEGYRNGFGSDADHLKTTADIDLMLEAGFSMFTFDPGEHVDNNADNYSEEVLFKVVAELPWNDLDDAFPSAERRYVKKEIKISNTFTIKVDTVDFLRAYAKYGKAVAHIKKMYDHLKSKCSEDKFEVEVSVDETESVTSPFEHYFFANELTRLGVKYVSLAPRFVGAFEKGIDYKGDLEVFKTEYLKHLAIVKHFGNYKISLHSGSDKFSVYKVIGSLHEALTHVKTAGTSYLEALKVVAAKQPDLFREILDYCSGLYESEKLSYHVSAELSKVKPANQYTDTELVEIFNSNDVRQVLHVTYGKVVTDKDSNGNFIFKDKIMQCLIENEETHYDFLIKHFHKHLEPFN